MITHERAREAARRLIAGAFRRDKEHLDSEKRPRFSIPARPDEDDDLVLCEYLRQQAALQPAPFNPATSPGMTDMMVSPESLDAFMEANPLTHAPDYAAGIEAAAFKPCVIYYEDEAPRVEFLTEDCPSFHRRCADGAYDEIRRMSDKALIGLSVPLALRALLPTPQPVEGWQTGAEAMREAAKAVLTHADASAWTIFARAILALPLPTPPASTEAK